MARSSQTHFPLVASPKSSIRVRPDSKVLDTVFDVSSVVLTTLKDISKFSATPLAYAAGIAVEIYGVAQVARQNKKKLGRLAKDACELVYVVVTTEAELPSDLTENLEQLVDTLASIQTFAQNGASRGFWKALLHSGLYAAKIAEYRAKLEQSMHIFGLQSNIKLRETVAKLASQQLEMLEVLKKQATPDGSATLLPLETLNPAESTKGLVGTRTVPPRSLDSIILSESPANSMMGDNTSGVGSDAAMIPAPHESYYAAVLAGVCAIAKTVLGEDDIPVVF